MILSQSAPVLADLFTGGTLRQTRARQAMLIVGGILALVLASTIRIPFWPVPVTLQTLAVLSIGAAYGPRLGLATVGLWLALGALGVPVFSGDAAGVSYFMGTTGGYLLGFAMAAAFLGQTARAGWDRSPWKMALAMLIGNAIIYVPGVLWLGQVVGWEKPVLEWGLTNFLISDAVKLAIAAMVFPALWRWVGRARA